MLMVSERSPRRPAERAGAGRPQTGERFRRTWESAEGRPFRLYGRSVAHLCTKVRAGISAARPRSTIVAPLHQATAPTAVASSGCWRLALVDASGRDRPLCSVVQSVASVELVETSRSAPSRRQRDADRAPTEILGAQPYASGDSACGRRLNDLLGQRQLGRWHRPSAGAVLDGQRVSLSVASVGRCPGQSRRSTHEPSRSKRGSASRFGGGLAGRPRRRHGSCEPGVFRQRGDGLVKGRQRLVSPPGPDQALAHHPQQRRPLRALDLAGADGGRLGQALGRRRELAGRIDPRQPLRGSSRRPPRGGRGGACPRQPEPALRVVRHDLGRAVQLVLRDIRQASPKPPAARTRTRARPSRGSPRPARAAPHRLETVPGRAESAGRLEAGPVLGGRPPPAAARAPRPSRQPSFALAGRPRDAVVGAPAAGSMRAVATNALIACSKLRARISGCQAG